jgi:hypothetical protein
MGSQEGFHTQILCLIQNLFNTFLTELILHDGKAESIHQLHEARCARDITTKLKHFAHRIAEDADRTLMPPRGGE